MYTVAWPLDTPVKLPSPGFRCCRGESAARCRRPRVVRHRQPTAQQNTSWLLPREDPEPDPRSLPEPPSDTWIRTASGRQSNPLGHGVASTRRAPLEIHQRFVPVEGDRQPTACATASIAVFMIARADTAPVLTLRSKPKAVEPCPAHRRPNSPLA